MRSEIARIQQEIGATTIYVTHDQVEAMTMGDRVVVLKDGILQQADKPSVLYNKPANLFVAGFIGSPAMNLFEATLRIGDDALHLGVGDQTLDISLSYLDEHTELRRFDGQKLVCGIRPDDVYDPAFHPEHAGRLRGEILLLEALGSEVVAHLDIGVARVESGDPDLKELSDEADDLSTGFLGRFNPRSAVKVGQTVDAAVDVTALHFFDPSSGNAIAG